MTAGHSTDEQEVSAPRDTRRGWLMLGCFVVGEVTFLVASLLVVLPYALASPRQPAAGSLPPAALVLVLLVPTVLAAVVATTGAALLGQGNLVQRLRSQLSLRWRLSDVGVGLVLGVVGLVITVPAAALWARWVGTSEANSAVGEAFDGLRLPLGMALILFFGVWLVAPLCEEVLYRGVLWRAVEYWQWNRWVILGLTTALFSVAHLELLRTPLLVVISLPIALARMLTGNLLASIVTHQANNFLPAVGLLLITQGLVPG
ncbi:MAG TPA: CPBP family intramembrane glutamic endopeptidase [Pseudonocardiaceae bacterium]|nr:CPBP family intramembrane glutamic endopeptidase [Pseudonocardiaceae bacterium]